MRRVSLLVPVCVSGLMAACEPLEADKAADGAFDPGTQAPSAVILSHSPGDTEDDAHAFTVVGQVADADTPAEQLDIRWWADGEPVCAGAVPDAEGAVTCSLSLSHGDAELVLQAEDAAGNIGEDSVQITILATGAPQARIDAPSSNGRFFANVPVTLQGQVSDAEDAIEDLAVLWTANRSAEPFDISIDEDGRVTGTATLTTGHWELSLQVTDSSGKSTTVVERIEVEPEDGGPVCTIATPSEGDVSEMGAMWTLSGQVEDEETAPGQLTAQWASSLDGAIWEGPVDAAGVALAETTLSVGTHTLTLSGVDGADQACSAETTVVVGVAPAISWLSPAAATTFDEGDTVVLEVSVEDDDTASAALQVRFEVDGEVVGVAVDDGGDGR